MILFCVGAVGSSEADSCEFDSAGATITLAASREECIKNCTELLWAGRCGAGRKTSKLTEHGDASCNTIVYWLMIKDHALCFTMSCATHPAQDAISLLWTAEWRKVMKKPKGRELRKWLWEFQPPRVDVCLQIILFSESLLTLEANMSYHSSAESMIGFQLSWGWYSKMWRCGTRDLDTISRVQQSSQLKKNKIWLLVQILALGPWSLWDFLSSRMSLVLLHSYPV